MNFCENCHTVSEEERCPLCGSKRLRPVNDDDFCLLTEKKNLFVDELLIAFEENDIPYTKIPYGSGVEAQFALPLKNYRLFVPFSHFEMAKGLIKEIDKAATDVMRKPILDNLDMLNISPKLEKKIRKKAKLSDDIDVFDYCIDVIENAEKVVDGGVCPGIKTCGRWLYCYYGKQILALNSKTFEILAFDIIK